MTQFTFGHSSVSSADILQSHCQQIWTLASIWRKWAPENEPNRAPTPCHTGCETPGSSWKGAAPRGVSQGKCLDGAITVVLHAQEQPDRVAHSSTRPALQSNRCWLCRSGIIPFGISDKIPLLLNGSSTGPWSHWAKTLRTALKVKEALRSE